MFYCHKFLHFSSIPFFINFFQNHSLADEAVVRSCFLSCLRAILYTEGIPTWLHMTQFKPVHLATPPPQLWPTLHRIGNPLSAVLAPKGMFNLVQIEPMCTVPSTPGTDEKMDVVRKESKQSSNFNKNAFQSKACHLHNT